MVQGADHVIGKHGAVLCWPGGNQSEHLNEKNGRRLEFTLRQALMHTRRYSSLRGLTFSSCGGFWPLAEAFNAVCAYIRPLLVFSSNLCNF